MIRLFVSFCFGRLSDNRYQDIIDSFEGRHGQASRLYNIIYYFSVEKGLELLNGLRSMLASDGVVSVAMHFQSMGKDLGAANLNMVNCSFERLTPLPALDELIAQLKESGLGDVKISRLIPGNTFYGITAARRDTAH